MNLHAKVNLFFLVIAINVTTILFIMNLYAFRSFSIIFAPVVSQQFSQELKQETATDPTEKLVLESSTVRYEVLHTAEGGTLTQATTIPFITTASGQPTYLDCHRVIEGTVLGAVTLPVSIDGLLTKTPTTVAAVTAIVVGSTFFAFILLHRPLGPIVSTTTSVEEVVQRALYGDFKARITQFIHDKIGQISARVDGHVSTNVARSTSCTPAPDENRFNMTIDMVENTIHAAHFKQAIGKDKTTVEVYRYLERMLEEKFAIKNYSLYEVGAANNQITSEQNVPYRADAHLPICLPIIQSGTVGNILQLIMAPDKESEVTAQVPHITVYRRETASVLEARKLIDTLWESSLCDSMTGLNNRRFLEEYMGTLIAYTQRRGTHLAVMMLDLDYFKMVNDTYGHDAGDTVIKALAKILRQSVRTSDLVIRFGGEEFLVILLDTTTAAADHVAEQIRLAVEQLEIKNGYTVLRKTISIGLADFPDDSDTFWQTIKFADIALYQAKEGGRNRVVRFGCGHMVP